MSHILPLNKRSEGNVIDYTIKRSRKLLWNAFLNTSLFKYSKKGSQAERQKEKRKKGRRGRKREGRKGRREGGRERGREQKEEGERKLFSNLY